MIIQGFTFDPSLVSVVIKAQKQPHAKKLVDGDEQKKLFYSKDL